MSGELIQKALCVHKRLFGFQAIQSFQSPDFRAWRAIDEEAIEVSHEVQAELSSALKATIPSSPDPMLRSRLKPPADLCQRGFVFRPELGAFSQSLHKEICFPTSFLRHCGK